MKSDANPMHKAHASPRCHAKTKRTGQACKAPAVKGWRVCRMHGAGGGAPQGSAHPNYRHGGRSAETNRVRNLGAVLSRMARNLCDDI